MSPEQLRILSEQNNGYRTYVAVGFTIGITCVTILLRVLARKVKKLSLGADDYMIFIGAGFTIITAGFWIWGVQNGIGRHLITLESQQIINYFKADYIIYQTYGVALTSIKLSILLFYRRIFVTRSFRLQVNIVGALVIVWLFVNAFVAAFQCNPVKKEWMVEIPGKCMDPLNYIVGVHSTNIALDFIILALPMSGVWRLQMSVSKKIGVAAIFLLGGLSIIIAIIRLIVILKAELDDITWYTGIASWTCVEPGVEVLSVSLPSMAPFLQGRKFLADLHSSFRSLLSFSRKSNPDSESGVSGGFCEIGRSTRNLDPADHEWSSSATRAKAINEESDHIPLHSIRVTDQVDIA
ncbi:hypothetical protein EV356DRAFT_520173 [Viridothelium virens]|uniref:Rhodopsin domain-containing protein n=1 Tax=Viridothelium virens TaxID=1048519 RepID=A0A6A6GWP8_VIRVR|nr:hypothetical protein EV356DRAFT_520173 [Viridothelium virens]